MERRYRKKRFGSDGGKDSVIGALKKVLHTVGQAFCVLFGFGCEARRQAVDAGACDYSGEGKDKYGR